MFESCIYSTYNNIIIRLSSMLLRNSDQALQARPEPDLGVAWAEPTVKQHCVFW
jgi:hypothetical protein